MRWLVVGLGAMGEAFSRRLVACGGTVVGVDPDAAARGRAEAIDGVRGVPEAGDAGSWDASIVIVRTPTQVDETLTALSAMSREGVPAPVFVCSTIDVETARRLPSWTGGPLRVVEAPVTGLVDGALEGRLTIMVAGDTRDGDLGLLRRTLARRVVTFEAYGQPTLAKLLNNCLLAYNAHALTAILERAAAEGLPPARLMEVLEEGSGGSFAASRLATLVPDLIDKDVDLLIDSIGALAAIQPGTNPVAPVIDRARVLAGVKVS